MDSESLSITLISLGCAKNLVDSQIMAAYLLGTGLVFSPDPAEADIVLVNTCAFIAEAREESAEAILSACALKKEGRCRAVLVSGCMPQRYAAGISEIFPDVDGFIGLDELDRIGEIALSAVDEHERPIVSISKTATRLFEPAFPELVLTGGPYAYLKIAEGCDHQCSFCAIPAIRGSRRSRSMENIVKEAQALLDNGIRELDIIAQDVTAYGKDLDSAQNFPDLLRELCRLEGDYWIRLLYGYPTGVTDELLEVIADNQRVCNYLDVPVQHSHPEILKAMRRSETADMLESMIRKAREIIPGITLRTTCLVGFPGETEDHFEHLLDFVERMEFDHLGAFVFSPEENTPAFELPDRPDPAVAEERRWRLMEAQRSIVDRRTAPLIGTETSVLVERQHPEEPSLVTGRSERFAPEIDGEIFIEGSSEEDIGKFIKVGYIEQLDYDLRGKKV